MTNPETATPPTSSGVKRGVFIGAGISIGVVALLACIGSAVAFSAITKAREDVRKGWNLVPVLVAAVDVPENTVITMEMISQRSIPEQFVTSSVVKPDSASYIINQKILVASQAGDPLLWSQFETTKGAERLADKTAPNQRVVSIKAGGELGVGGWVRPDDHVDVVATFVAPDTKELTTVTLLENVHVVATGRITGTTNVNLIPESERRYEEVTVSVSEEDGERIAFMARLGTLSLALRNPNTPASGAPMRRQTVKSVLTR